MSDEMIFSPNEAVLSNLDRLSKENSIISEQRLLELYDIARPMADATVSLSADGFDMYETLSAIFEGFTLGNYPISEQISPEGRDLVQRSLNSLCRVDRALLVELYNAFLSEKGQKITESNFLPSVENEQTFTYVRNSFSDEAYDVFSQDFTDPKVRYSATFRECADLVSRGEVTYCLLPLEEKGGVRLPTVSEIIFRNDFRINSVIPVFGPDGNADIKYALLSKSFSAPKRRDDDDFYLEIRLGTDNKSDLADVTFATEYFGMSIYRINTVTFDTEGESETYFSVVIKSTQTDFTPILIYLTLFVRDFVPVGIYKNLE